MDKNKTELPLHFRYIAVSNEINVRLQLRQNALTMYTTWSLAILGLVASTDAENCRFLYFLPFLSLLFVVLIRMHEEMIENLYQFLRRAESLDSKGGRMAEAFPAYNWDEIYRTNVMKSRKSNDWIIIGLITVVYTAACFLLKYKINDFSSIDCVFTTISSFIYLFCLFSTFKFRSIRHRNLKSHPYHYDMVKDRPILDINNDAWRATSEDNSP